MGRVGSRPEDLSAGGSQYELPAGRYRITRAVVKNEAIPGTSGQCGYQITAQPLDASWKPTNDEPREEFIMAGWCESNDGPGMHPGRAAGSDDNDPELEIEGKLDLGADADVEGTCLLTSGPGPRKDSELALFSSSAIEHGVKKDLFNGYAPNLVGLEAELTRLMLPAKPGNAKQEKYPPTALIIGRGGKVGGADTKDLVHKYPNAQTGATASAKGPVAVGAKAKVNGVAAAAPTPAAEVEAPASAAEPDAEVAAKAVELLSTMTDSNAGQTLTAQRIGAKMTTLLAKDRVDGKPLPSAVNKGVQALIKDAAWLGQTAEDLGWSVSGANLTIPAAG